MYNLFKKQGFTLLEVLIAVAISSVIIVGLMLAFWRGSMVWERVKEVTGLTSNIEFTGSILKADLENAIKLPKGSGIDNFKFIEEGKKIIFFSLKRLKKDKVPRIYKVGYELEKVEDSSKLYNLKRASHKITSMEELEYKFSSSEYKKLIDNLYGKNIKFRGTLFGGVLKLCSQKEKEGEIIEELSVRAEDNKNIVFPPKVIYIFNES